MENNRPGHMIAALSVLLLLMPSLLKAQLKLYPSAQGANVMRPGAADVLPNPWAGGLLNPMVSNIDLDRDGVKDLFIFEPYDEKVLTFRNLGGGVYRYEPEYESFFPPLRNFALLVDYNKDGKEDIFTYSREGGGMAVYQNVSDSNSFGFKQVVSLLMYQDVDFDLNLYVGATDLPAIADVDGDGDIDVVSLDVFQSNFQYYRNMSMEKHGTADSLDYAIADRCWGKMQTTLEDTMRLGFSCGKIGKIAPPEPPKTGTGGKALKNMHGSNAATILDTDGDGDADMLVGNLFYPNLLHINNGRIKDGQPNFPIDSAISQDNDYPSNTRKASMTIYPAAFIADVDGDGVRDMIVSPQAQEESITQRQVFFYRNTGTDAKVNFQFIQDDFLQNGMVDAGIYAAPAFWDYNNDGLMDMVIAQKGNPEISYSYDKLVLYKNTGNGDSAVFTQADTNWAGYKAREATYTCLSFADLNGDGKQDMLAGSDNGKLSYYENKGLVDGIPDMQFVTDEYAGIDIGGYSAPCLADMDNDGLPDLVTGRQDGRFSYYHNNGSATVPDFQLVSDSFGNVRTNEYYYNYIYDNNGKLIDSTREMVPAGHSSPQVADIDGDGKPDMLSGSTGGRLFFYFDITQDLAGTLQERHDVLYNTLKEENEDKDFGLLSRPASVALDGDSIPELLIGNYRGGLYYYGSQKKELSSIFRINPPVAELRLYPNPVREMVVIEFAGGSVRTSGHIEIYNAAGQLVGTRLFLASEQQVRINTSLLSRGLYMVRFSGRDGSAATARFIRE